MRNLLHRAACIAALVFVTIWVALPAAFAGARDSGVGATDDSVLLRHTAKVSTHRRALLDDGLCEADLPIGPGQGGSAWFDDAWGFEDGWGEAVQPAQPVQAQPVKDKPSLLPIAAREDAVPSLIEALHASEEFDACDLGWFNEQLSHFGLTLPRHQCALLVEELLERTMCVAGEGKGCATETGGLPPPPSRGVQGGSLGSAAGFAAPQRDDARAVQDGALAAAFLQGRVPWLESTELISRIERPPEFFGQ